MSEFNVIVQIITILNGPEFTSEKLYLLVEKELFQTYNELKKSEKTEVYLTCSLEISDILFN